MAVLVHQPLTNSHLGAPARFVPWQRPNWLARLAATLRLWQRRSRERRELARLSERELRDMRVSSSDVWHEIRLPFWRGQPPC